ncbi:hypothetical protein FRC18_007741 [Serendipita sp. 400]|nr:hypothetical protein FRC18_007741 [Serendipita sp. 400]
MNSQSGTKSSIYEDFWNLKRSLNSKTRGSLFIQSEEDFQELKQSLEQGFERERQELRRQEKLELHHRPLQIWRIVLLAYSASISQSHMARKKARLTDYRWRSCRTAKMKACSIGEGQHRLTIACLRHLLSAFLALCISLSMINLSLALIVLRPQQPTSNDAYAYSIPEILVSAFRSVE